MKPANSYSHVYYFNSDIVIATEASNKTKLRRERVLYVLLLSFFVLHHMDSMVK